MEMHGYWNSIPSPAERSGSSSKPGRPGAKVLAIKGNKKRTALSTHVEYHPHCPDGFPPSSEAIHAILAAHYTKTPWRPSTMKLVVNGIASGLKDLEKAFAARPILEAASPAKSSPPTISAPFHPPKPWSPRPADATPRRRNTASWPTGRSRSCAASSWTNLTACSYRFPAICRPRRSSRSSLASSTTLRLLRRRRPLSYKGP